MALSWTRLTLKKNIKKQFHLDKMILTRLLIVDLGLHVLPSNKKPVGDGTRILDTMQLLGRQILLLHRGQRNPIGQFRSF